MGNLPNLSDIVLYHVVEGLEQWSCLQLHEKHNAEITSLNGQSFQVSVSDANKISLLANDPKNGIADIIACDLKARNGILHVIDRVMLPDDNSGRVMNYDNE